MKTTAPASLKNVPWQEKLADRLDPQPDPHLHDPVGWVKDKLGEFCTRDQERILTALETHPRVAVQSCHDVGKSFVGSRKMAQWIDVHPQGEAFAVSTAPTSAQVGAILWRELGRAHRKGGLSGRILGTNEWKLDAGGELVAQGRKPADYDPAAFQGIHARYVLVVIDEACGVPKSIFDAVESIATNRHARVLAIGNPDDPSAYFAEVCRPNSGWHVIQIDALRSPNFTAAQVRQHPDLLAYMIREGIPPTDEVIPEQLSDLLISPDWVAERLRRWGPDSPLFQSKVRGRFPHVANDTLIHPHWVELAKARELQPLDVDPRMGVDVARYGVDHSIIMLRLGGHCRVVEDVAYGPTTDLAGLVVHHGSGRPNTPVANVDDTGVGGGVTDILRALGYPVLPVNNGEAQHSRRPQDFLKNGKPRFANRRAEVWWNMREAFAGPSGRGEDGWLDIDPEDTELHAQLTNVKYKILPNGQIAVEEKDATKKRLKGASPDRADALALALLNDPLDGDKAQTHRMMTADLMNKEW